MLWKYVPSGVLRLHIFVPQFLPSFHLSRSYFQILDLARLLRVYHEDEDKEKGRVHVLIADTSLEVSKYFSHIVKAFVPSEF